MVTFQEALANDVANVFMNTDEFASSFTLQRGNVSATSGVAAIVVAREYDMPLSDQVLSDVRQLDLDVSVSAYVIKSAAVTPQRADRFTNAAGEAFEVMPLPGRQCYELTGDGLVYRVHVKQVT